MRNLIRFALLLLSIAALAAGCSDSNDNALEQVHPDISVWYQQHRTATTRTTYVNDCSGCHVVKSGSSPAVPPSCFSSSFKGLSCHEGGPANAPHIVGDSWLLKSNHATDYVNSPLNYCFGCHTLDNGGVSPTCESCHQVAPIGDLTTAGCPSCHSYPPDGVTPVTTDPNRAGKHGEHYPAFASDCDTCHDGGGTDTASHAAEVRSQQLNLPLLPVTVSFLSAYNAKSGTASYTATDQTCATVICHGGVTTPNWYTGTLPTTDPSISNDYCLSCHVQGQTEYNGFFSGQHAFHVLFIRCVQCHNTTTLQNGVGGAGPTHWSNLDTPAFELAPADTVGGGTTIAIYNGTTCTNTQAGCHPGETRTW